MSGAASRCLGALGRWLWLAAVLWVFCVWSPGAEAGTARVCFDVGAYNGMTFGECVSAGAVEGSEIGPGDYVMVFPLDDELYCWNCYWLASEAASHEWGYRDEVLGADNTPWSELGYLGGGGGDLDPPDSGGDGSEIDLEAFGEAFAAAFVLVAVFWGLGKGVALVVSVIRDR